MPGRVIRESLIDSDRWLSLPDHACRLAYLICLLTADTLGNMEASPGQLKRSWRRIEPEIDDRRVAEICTAMQQNDLVRPYVVEGKRYLHIPRFKQYPRYITNVHPRPPRDIEDSRISKLLENHTVVALGSLEEVKRSKSKTNRMQHTEAPQHPVDNSVKNSDTTTNGSVKKSDTAPRTQLDRARRLGELLGLQRDPLDTDASFVDRVQAELDKRAVRLGTGR